MSDNFYDTFQSEKPESFSEEVFITQSKKINVRWILLPIVLIPIVIIFFLMGQVKVPDFQGWSASDVMNWSKKNGPTIISSQSFNESIEENMVVSQGLPPGEKVSKKGSVEVEFSKGADPNESIVFPDVKKMKLEEIQTWIKSNNLDAISISYDFSDTIEKNDVISFSFTDGDASNYKRKNRVKISISKGPQVLSETLTMTDLYGKTKEEVTKWSIDNKIKLEEKSVFNDYVSSGAVIEQSIPKDSKFNRTDTLLVTFSKGKPINVPTFTGLSRSEAEQLASLKGIKLFIKSVASSGESDKVLYQDQAADSEIDGSVVVELQVSKASQSITVPDFIGYSKEDANSLAALKGMKVFFKSVESTKKAGQVLKQSHGVNTILSSDDVLVLEISNGNQVVPDLKGLSEIEINALVKKSGLNVAYKPVKNMTYKNGLVMKQSISPGEICSDDDTVILSVATNSGVKAMDFSKWKQKDLEQWAKSKNVNLVINEVYMKEYDAGILIDQSYSNLYLIENEPFFVTFTKGDVLVESFVGKTKTEVMKWVDEQNEMGAGLEITYKSTSSSKFNKGEITAQSKSNTYVKIGEKLTFYECTAVQTQVVSKKVIPSFTNMTESEVINWCGNNQVSYSVLEGYHNTIESGRIYEQSHIGEVDASTIVKVKRSIGKVIVTDFTSAPKTDVLSWLEAVNLKGGNITVNYTNSPSGTVTVDHVISQSHTGTVDIGTSITIDLSTG